MCAGSLKPLSLLIYPNRQNTLINHSVSVHPFVFFFIIIFYCTIFKNKIKTGFIFNLKNEQKKNFCQRIFIF